jgi:hypothetical protein
MYLIGLLLVVSIATVGLMSAARPTSAFIPVVEDGADGVMNTDIVTEFFYANSYKNWEEKVDSGTIGIVNGNRLKIDAGDSSSKAGVNRVYSKTLHHERSTQRGDYPLYTIEIEFYPMGTGYHWFILIDNGDVCLFLRGGQNPALWAYEGTSDTLIGAVYKSTATTVNIDVYASDYDVYLDSDGDGDPDDTETDIGFSASMFRDYVRFGDFGGNDYGYVEYEYFILKGHVSDDVKFFESFNDGNAENWFLKCDNPWNQYIVDSLSLQDNSDGHYGGEDYYLQFDYIQGLTRTIANTPYIDLVRGNEYRISLKFQIKDDFGYHWFIILSDNDDIVLYLSGSAGNVKLKAYHGNNQNTDILTLDPDEWYFLEVHRSGNQYDVYVDFVNKNTFNVRNDGKTKTWIRIGDYNWYNDYYDIVYVDDVMLRQDIDIVDSDSDDVSDDFEENPFCPIFIDDFEYALPFREYGWHPVVENANDAHRNIWEVDLPETATADPDYGIIHGMADDNRPRDERSRILGTNIGAPYPINMDLGVKSPILSIPAGGGVAADSFTIKIEIWMWWDFEWNKDGGRVRVEWWDDAGGGPHATTVTTIWPNGGYPCANVQSLPGQGYSGSSGTWKKEVFELHNNQIRDVFFRLIFDVASDDVHTEDWGWYIDDVKIHISMVTSGGAGTGQANTDGDGNTMTDSFEIYTYGTSPMASDSDFDSINDGMEVEGECELGAPFGGDPHVRNIFLEVDWMFDNGAQWAHFPPTAELEEIQEGFEDHDIMFFFDIDSQVDDRDSDTTLVYQDPIGIDFMDTHAETDPLDDYPRFQFLRTGGWHYALFAHENGYGVGGANDPGLIGVSAFGMAHFIIYNGNVDAHPNLDDDDIAGLVAHELGHDLGLYDYDSADAYNGAVPPGSTMDYNTATDLEPQPNYLGDESYIYYDCLVNHQADFHWGANDWCYGGWQYSRAQDDYWTGATEGHWTAGLLFRSVLYRG